MPWLFFVVAYELAAGGLNVFSLLKDLGKSQRGDFISLFQLRSSYWKWIDIGDWFVEFDQREVLLFKD